MKSFIILFLVVFIFQIQTQAAVLKSKSGFVKFIAVGKPGFLKIHGDSSSAKPEGFIQVKNDMLQGEFTFDLRSLKTGIDLRDEHMKNKYLEVSKFPNTKLVISSVAFKESDLIKDIKKDFSGYLTLHGVTKEIFGTVDYNGTLKKLFAKFKVELSDFAIAVPEHMGITVSKTADVEVSLELEEKP